MCEKCDTMYATYKHQEEEQASPVLDAWSECEKAAQSLDMEISRLETDEDPTGQRWIAWAKYKNSQLARGKYGALGMTPQEALLNLASMLKGEPR